MGLVIFNGISSQDYGIQVEHPPDYQVPARDFETVHVPGRNGDLVIDKGSFQNVTRTYELAVGNAEKDFTSMANRIAEWLSSASGYARLEDSYEPEYYRMAAFYDTEQIENVLSHAGRVTVDFDCKPQRFLKTGEDAVELYSGTVLYNPTGFASLPSFTIYGTGSGVLYVEGYTVRISSIGGSIVVDSDIQDAYTNTVNRNADITLDSGFPKLAPGENGISWSGGVTGVEVVPRWWTI